MTVFGDLDESFKNTASYDDWLGMYDKIIIISPRSGKAYKN